MYDCSNQTHAVPVQNTIYAHTNMNWMKAEKLILMLLIEEHTQIHKQRRWRPTTTPNHFSYRIAVRWVHIGYMSAMKSEWIGFYFSVLNVLFGTDILTRDIVL